MGIFDILKNNKKQTSRPLNTNLPNGSNGSNGSSKISFSDIQYPLNTNLDLSNLNNNRSDYTFNNNLLPQNGNQQANINNLDIQNQNFENSSGPSTINNDYYPNTNNYNTYNQPYGSVYGENANNNKENKLNGNGIGYNNTNSSTSQQKSNQEIDPLDLELEKYLNMSQENQNSFQSDQINEFQGIKDSDINMSENLNNKNSQNNFNNPSPTLENSRNPVDTELTNAFFSQETENEFNNVTENSRQSNTYPETSTSEDDIDLSKLIQDLETSSITNNKTDTAIPSNMNSNQTQATDADQNQELRINDFIEFQSQNSQNQDIQSTQDYENTQFSNYNSNNSDDGDDGDEESTNSTSNTDDDEDTKKNQDTFNMANNLSQEEEFLSNIKAENKKQEFQEEDIPDFVKFEKDQDTQNKTNTSENSSQNNQQVNTNNEQNVSLEDTENKISFDTDDSIGINDDSISNLDLDNQISNNDTEYTIEEQINNIREDESSDFLTEDVDVEDGLNYTNNQVDKTSSENKTEKSELDSSLEENVYLQNQTIQKDNKSVNISKEKPKQELISNPQNIEFNRFFRTIAFVGLNSGYVDRKIENALVYVAKELVNKDYNILVDSNRSYGESILYGLNELPEDKVLGRVTGVFLKPMFANYSDFADVFKESYEYQAEIYSNFLEKMTAILSKSGLIIIPESTRIYAFSIFTNMWTISSLYGNKAKPIILVGDSWKQKTESLQNLLKPNKYDLDCLYFARTQEEILNLIVQLENKMSNKPKIRIPKIIDVRTEESETCFMV